jgi:hypothetical protein
MRPKLRVVVNRSETHQVACAEDVDSLCNVLAGLRVFAVHVTGEGGELGPTLAVLVESGRALVDYRDIGRGIKLGSRDEKCTQRGIVSLRNDDFPEMELDQIEDNNVI